jgi:phytoene synthase
MCALYAFMRIADDLSDEPGLVEQKKQRLVQWRLGLDQALRGSCTHPAHAALCHTMTTYQIPKAYLHDVLDGVEMDLAPLQFATFADLRLYCYRVASAVGLACIHVWGFTDDRAKEFAEQAGIAFQLTNILRDLGEDAARGRLYLPREDLDRFGIAPESLRRGERTAAFQRLMEFEAARARQHYEAAWPLAGLLPPPGRAVFVMMARTYQRLLQEIEASDFDVFSRRIQVSAWRKLLFALEAVPVRFGWLR